MESIAALHVVKIYAQMSRRNLFIAIWALLDQRYLLSSYWDKQAAITIASLEATKSA